MGPLITVGVLFAIFAGGGLYLFMTYNRLVALRNRCRNAWSQIDVQLKRRHDLIPNLVETVKGYAAHEKEALENVIAARARAVAANDTNEQRRAEGELSTALGRLMMVTESYPQLQANENFLSLQEELTSTENRVGFSRQHFNDQAQDYNTLAQSFPANFIAAMFQFREEAYYVVDEPSDRNVPQVSF